MAFSATVSDRVNFGNKKMIVYNLTDVQDDGTSSLDTGLQNVYKVWAINNTDTADTFKEAISSTVRGRVTFTSITNDDDGVAVVIGD